MVKINSGGGFRAIHYTWRKGRQAGGFWKLYTAMRSRNACKTCALGMGGQRGGMVNEAGAFPEVCKKSLQAMVADMQPAIKPTFWAQHPVADLQRMSPYQLEHLGRLIQPIRYRRDAGGQPGTHFETISWREALETIVAKLKATDPDETFWYFSGRSSNEAAFLLQLLARLYGTNNVNNCSYYCHQASGEGLQSSIGSGTATLVLEDLDHADCVFVIGGNPASNHPRLMTSLMHLRRRGGKVIVINPVREVGLVKFRVPSDPRSLLFGTKIATHYLQPHIGGDLALLWGIAKALHDIDAIDTAFLAEHCREVECWYRALETFGWEEIETKSGVARSKIENVAKVYASSRRSVFAWTMGITHHKHGVQNVQAIANLALARGMVGRPGCGLMPIRGHSNVQGIGSMGVTPTLKKQIFSALQKSFGIPLPTQLGKDTLSCVEAADQRQLKVGFCLGGNLYGSNPDAKFAARALSKLDLSVMLSTSMNTGHVHGLAAETIILPVLPRDEEPQPTTQESMFNFVRLSDGGPRRLPGPRSEVEVVAEIATRLLPPAAGIDWQSLRQTQAIRHWIGSIVPGYEQVGSIDQTKQEFQITGRTLHEPKFPTADGRALLHVHALPSLQGTADGQLRLMTVRSEGQFNTVVFEEQDLYRHQDRRDVILLHTDDLRHLDLRHNQSVTVISDTGRLPNIFVRRFDAIRPGNALMYYPEANELVSRQTDPQSKTPAFKGVVVRIEATDWK